MGNTIGIIGGADGPTSIFVGRMDSMLGMSRGFTIFGTIIILIVVGVFVSVSFGNVRRSVKNSCSPQLTVSALVVAKRTHVWGDHAHTDYYVTFQVDSGDRMEMQVTGKMYGLLAEGDQGQLTFRGTRFLTFERQ